MIPHSDQVEARADAPRDELGRCSAASLRLAHTLEIHCANRLSRLVPMLPDIPASDPPVARLSARELLILRLVAGGYSNKEISRARGISDGTVKNYLSEVLRKLEAPDRTHAVIKALAARML